MNDDPPTSSDHTGPSSEGSAPHNDAAPSAALAAPGSSSSDPSLTTKHQRNHRNLDFLNDLIRNIDILIYAQLSVLYYMDCSLTKFALRAFPHWFYFTPKPSIFPPPPLAHRPYIGIIFGTNALCLLLHLLTAPPVAGEATRGYLHGGMVIDFVGQASPVGRWRLLSEDLLVWALQIIILGITLERRGLDKVEGSGADTQTREGLNEEGQDHDAEERGVLRRGDEDADGIEMRDLRPLPGGRTDRDADREQEGLLRADGDSGGRHKHPLDSFYTGNHVVADLHILDTIRAQWLSSAASAEIPASAASGTQAASVNAMAGRILTYRFRGGTQENG
ncbi:hypothetical protein MMC21_000291 [Puttea exsequens]|nr:hypothetical protein [Puttea exsequens]